MLITKEIVDGNKGMYGKYLLSIQPFDIFKTALRSLLIFYKELLYYTNVYNCNKKEKY